MNFIKKITIKNFFSIKNEIELNLEASEYTKEQHPYRLFKYKDEYFNKLGVLYGANASGKTTILKALVFVSHIISNKSEIFPRSYKNIYNNSNKLSFIEINFIFEDKEYFYRINFLTQKHTIIGIRDEILKIKYENNFITLIDRKKEIFKDLKEKNIDGILFDEVSNKKSLLVESLTRVKDYHEMVIFFNNILFLSNIKGTHKVNMNIRTEDEIILASLFSQKENNLLPFSERISEIDKKEFTNFIFPLLQVFGLDIKIAKSDIDIKKTDNKDEFNIEIEFLITHSVSNNKKLDFNLESNGTKMLFKILFDIFYAYKTNSILIIDELDSILHPMIVPVINLLAIKNNIQLIYSTHNINNMKYLYSDEIFLIEKDKKHITDIKDIKNSYEGYENFEILYEENLLGATPELGDKIDWEIK